MRAVHDNVLLSRKSNTTVSGEEPVFVVIFFLTLFPDFSLTNLVQFFKKCKINKLKTSATFMLKCI